MKRIMISICLFSLPVFFGCGKKDIKKGYEITDGPIAQKAPAWVNKGSGAFEDADGKKVFYGVGIISGVKNKALAIQAADQRARAEIAKSIESLIEILTRDYMVSTSSLDMTAPAEEQDVSVALKGFTKTNLKGAIIVDRWKDISDNTMFSLARLELEEFTQDLTRAEEIDDKLRDFVRANSDFAFEELAETESK